MQADCSLLLSNACSAVWGCALQLLRTDTPSTLDRHQQTVLDRHQSFWTDTGTAGQKPATSWQTPLKTRQTPLKTRQTPTPMDRHQYLGIDIQYNTLAQTPAHLHRQQYRYRLTPASPHGHRSASLQRYQHLCRDTMVPISLNRHHGTNTSTQTPWHQHLYTDTMVPTLLHRHHGNNTSTQTPWYQHLYTNTMVPIHLHNLLPTPLQR